MGQHKHNPNCKLAKEGKLPPKQRRKVKRETERELYSLCFGYIGKRLLDAWKLTEAQNAIHNNGGD